MNSNTSKGRGRGRGAVLHKQLPKPGENLDKSDLATLPNLIRSLPLEATNTELIPIADITAKQMDTDEKKNKVFNIIYAECKKNWKFSCSAAALCKRLVQYDENFRSVILSVLYKDYKERDKILGESETAYLGWLALISQVFARITTYEGELMAVLAEPILGSLTTSLSNNTESLDTISCCATQFLTTGRHLYSRMDTKDFNQILKTSRDIIINAEGSKQARLELVEVLEGFASEWCSSS